MLGVVWVALLSCSCNGAGPASMPSGDDNRSVEIAFSRPTFSPANYWPQCADSFQVVIRSQEEWCSFSAERTPWFLYGGLDVPPQPDIDFDNEMLIFMSGGLHPTGGYSLTIKGVTLYSDRLVVTYEEASPGPDDVVTMAFTYTGDLIKVSRHDLPVEFVRMTDPL
jgi:hypothetical protein